MLLLVLEASCTETVEVDPGTFAKNAQVVTEEVAAVVVPADFPVKVVTGDLGLPVKTRDGWLRGNAAAQASTTAPERDVRAVQAVLVHYPVAFLKRIGLNAIAVWQSLAFEGVACNAFADVAHGRLFLDAGVFADRYYLRGTSHHEIFHQVDYAGDGALDPDLAWESLNPPDFRYTGDAKRVLAETSAKVPIDRFPGFLNRYATCSPAAHKAELYCMLATQREYVRNRLARDTILRKKVDRIRRMIDALGSSSSVLLGD